MVYLIQKCMFFDTGPDCLLDSLLWQLNKYSACLRCMRKVSYFTWLRLSVFLTANAEIGNWENLNLVASRSSNDTTCSYNFKNHKTKIKNSNNYFLTFFFFFTFIACHHLDHWTIKNFIITLKIKCYSKVVLMLDPTLVRRICRTSCNFSP